jgi:hypothetical protein
MEPSEIGFWSVAIILAGISAFLSYLQWRGLSLNLKPKIHFPIKIQDVEIIRGRDSTIKKVSSMFKNAKNNDVIFGGCTNCSNFGENFYSNLAHAMKEGAVAQVLIPLDRNNKNAVKTLLGIKNIEVRNGDVGSLRIIGIKNKEVLFAFPQSGGDTYLSLHIPDSDVAKDIYASFAHIWNKSETITDNVLTKIQDD